MMSLTKAHLLLKQKLCKSIPSSFLIRFLFLYLFFMGFSSDGSVEHFRLHTPLFSATLLESITPPKITLKTDSSVLIEGQNIVLSLTIVHINKQNIEPRNIVLDEPTIQIKQIAKEVLNPQGLYDSDLQSAPVVSRYKIVLPSRNKGVYVLGPVHIQVDSCVFDSDQITVNVQSPVIDPSFRLTASLVNQDKYIYPGQTVLFEYKITYNRPMKLTREDLPLLNPRGFTLIGRPDITEIKGADNFVQLIRQKAQAISAGTYDLGSSLIEGMHYASFATPMQREELIPPLYRASAPSVIVTVLPFPSEGHFNNFYGAIGSFSWRSRLVTSSVIKPSDVVEIEYRASGRGDITSVIFPPQSVFPSLVADFIIDQWPSTGKIEANTITYTVRLKARRSGDFIIPKMAVASFDPTSKKYLTSTTLPLQIHVEGSTQDVYSQYKSHETGSTPLIDEYPIPISFASLTKMHCSSSFTWKCIIVIALLGLLEWVVAQIVQNYINKKKNNTKSEEKELSSQYFERAVMRTGRAKERLLLLKKAFFLRLYEVGLTDSVEEVSSALPSDAPSLVLETKSLIEEIDRSLFSASSHLNFTEIYQESILIYHKLKAMPTTRYKNVKNNY